ncbi:MAG: T9SS type A sorting domain-containing protein, partial [Flavobacteriales bacterium]
IEGKQFPNALGIFNYQPNDILQYDFTQDYTNGYDLFFTTGTAKYRVLSRMDLADSTIYSMHLIGVSQTQCYTPQEWTPCGTTHQQGEGQVYLVVQHDHFDAGNMFTTQWNTELFPGCVGRQEQSSFDSKTLLDVRLDDAQRYVFEQWHETEHYHLICPTEQDTNVFMTDMNTVFESTYVEGIGLTYENYYYFESGDSRSLSAYSINGSQFGSITPDDILLSVNDAEMVAHRIFPNPVNDHLNLSSVTPGTVCTILNTTGQVLLTQSTSSPTERIDVSSLVPGFYILNMAGTGPHRFVIAR